MAEVTEPPMDDGREESDLLSADAIRRLCRVEIPDASPTHKTRSSLAHQPPDVTLASITHGLRKAGPPVHVFVSWMLPCEDSLLEAERQEAISSPGGGRQLLCQIDPHHAFVKSPLPSR